MYSEIIANLRYGDSTGKDTKPDRFADLDSILDLLPDKGLRIHDIGCSSGVTSLDLKRSLDIKGKKFFLTISDRFLEVCYIGRTIKYIYDYDRNLRQIYLGRILCDSELLGLFFISRFLFKFLSLFVRKPQQADLKEKISLVDPVIQNCIDLDEVNARHYDIFNSDDASAYNFIRCMNLLNRAYFSDEQISAGVSNLIEALENKGFLQIGRTDIDGINRVSVYQKGTYGLVPILLFNGGSEIQDLIMIAEK
ncbi:hypothetical protein N9805_00430 [Paracoccaceae bacterium]|nr:hypothetical protein [Paracoccaceae bacterium]